MAIRSFVPDVYNGILILFPLASRIGAMRDSNLMTHSGLRDALRRNERQISIPNANLIVALERMCFANLTSIYEGPVTRKIVFDQTTSVTVNDDGVRTADGVVLNHNVTDRVCAYPVIACVNT